MLPVTHSIEFTKLLILLDTIVLQQDITEERLESIELNLAIKKAN